MPFHLLFISKTLPFFDFITKARKCHTILNQTGTYIIWFSSLVFRLFPFGKNVNSFANKALESWGSLGKTSSKKAFEKTLFRQNHTVCRSSLQMGSWKWNFFNYNSLTPCWSPLIFWNIHFGIHFKLG